MIRNRLSIWIKCFGVILWWFGWIWLKLKFQSCNTIGRKWINFKESMCYTRSRFVVYHDWKFLWNNLSNFIIPIFWFLYNSPTGAATFSPAPGCTKTAPNWQTPSITAQPPGCKQKCSIILVFIYIQHSKDDMIDKEFSSYKQRLLSLLI